MHRGRVDTRAVTALRDARDLGAVLVASAMQPPPHFISASAVTRTMYAIPGTWHPHIYHQAPKRLTPHSIADILQLMPPKSESLPTERPAFIVSNTGYVNQHKPSRDRRNGSSTGDVSSDKDTDEASSCRSSGSPNSVVDLSTKSGEWSNEIPSFTAVFN